MTGMLKSRSPLSQFIIFISIALAGLFIIGFFGTLLISAITGISLDTISDSSKWDINNPATITLIRGMQIVQFVALFVVPVFICSRLFSNDSKKYLGLKKPDRNLYYLAGCAALIAAIPVTNYLGLINRNIPLPDSIEQWIAKSEAEAQRTINLLVSQHTLKDLFLNIICIAGLAAVGEELLFRGMAQRLLIKMFKNHWAGIIVTAILFSAIHMQFYGFLPRFALGIILGVIYWYSGSLWVAMAAHFVYDALLITLIYFKPEMANETVANAKPQELLIPAIVSLTATFFLTMWMIKKSKSSYQNWYEEDLKSKNHPFDFDENVPE